MYKAPQKYSSSTFTILFVVSLLFVSSCSKAPERENPVGREHKLFHDSERVSWVDDSDRPLLATIWYPADKASIEKEWKIGIFRAGWSALSADIATDPKTFPLIILSHGTGGAALQLSWLAEQFAQNGFLVVAVNHHGNTAAESESLPHGFALWWERAQDISTLLDQLLSDPQFGSKIDSSRVGVAGFSLGGYTALSVAGAITSLDNKKQFCDERPDNPLCVLPPEAGISLSELELLVENDTKFMQSMERSNQPYLDSRVKAIYAIAPVHGPAFTTESLNQISIPVRIVAGTNDAQAIPEFNAVLVASEIPNSELELLQDVSHYTFLAPCNLKGKLLVTELCTDPKGIERNAVHRRVGADAVSFFKRNLAVKPK